MRTFTKEQLAEILAKHAAWRRGEPQGARADLAGADLADANLAGANLADAYLARADLADAKNVPSTIERTDPPTTYTRATTDVERQQRRMARAQAYRERHPDVPVVENLDSKILDAIGQPGQALDMSTWHTCETTHCRAGWAIHLAGKAGYELEKQTSAEDAGRKIYLASTGRAPYFFGDNESALDDLKRCAASEQAVAPTTDAKP